METRALCRRRLDLRLQRLLLPVQRLEPFLHVVGPEPRGNRVDDPGALGFGLRKLAARRPGALLARCIEPVELGMEGGDERLDRVRLHQVLPQQVDDESLELGPADALALLAGALAAGGAAGQVVAADRGEAAAAMAAGDEAREQVARPALLPEATLNGLLYAVARADPAEPVGDRLPECVVDDAELGHLLDDPLLRRIEAGAPLAALRILHVALPVPDQPADIEFVPEDAGTAGRVAADRGVAPGPPARSGHAFLVEGAGDLPRRAAGGVVPEDPADGCRLSLVDAAAAGDRFAVAIALHDDVVAEGIAAGRAAGPGQVLEVERPHHALDADMELADRAFRAGDQPDAEVGQPLVEAGGVLQVAGEAVEALGHHDFEGAGDRVPQERLVARAEGRGAAHSPVLVHRGLLPALCREQALAEPDLVLDRGVPLQVARIARIDRCPHAQ
nr:hypothetical protein [Oceanibacterium hippocampi]